MPDFFPNFQIENALFPKCGFNTTDSPERGTVQIQIKFLIHILYF